MIARFIAVVAWAALMYVLIAPISTLSYSNDNWLSDSHPTEIASDWLAEDFEPGETFLIVLDLEVPFFTHKGQELWNRLFEIEQFIGSINLVAETESPLSARSILQTPPSAEEVAIFGDEAENQLKISGYKRGIEIGAIDGPEHFEKLFMKSPYAGKLLSLNGYKYAIKVNTDTIGDSDSRARVIRNIRNLISATEYDNYVRYVGDAVVRDAINLRIGEDVFTLFALACAVIFAVLFFAGTDAPSSLLIAVVASSSAAVSMGAISAILGVMTAPGIILPTLVVTVTVADAMHIIKIWQHYRAEISSPKLAVLETARATWLPCLLASVSTAVGCGSFIGSDILLLSNFSYVAALIIVFIFPLMALTVWTALYLWDRQFRRALLMGYANLRTSVGEPRDSMDLSQEDEIYVSAIDLCVNYIATFVEKFKGLVLLATVAALVALSTGITQLKAESNFLAVFFDSDNNLRRDFELVDVQLGGSSGVDILLETSSDYQSTVNEYGDIISFFDTVSDDTTGGIDLIQAIKLKLAGIDKVLSVETVLEPLRMAHEAYFGITDIPSTNEQLSQEYFFLDFSRTEFQRSVIDPYLDFNHNTARISIRTADLLSSELEELLGEIEIALENIPGIKNVNYTFTGSGQFLYTVSSLVLNTQIISVIISMIFVTIFFFLQFHWRHAFAGTIATFLPVGATGGFMALLGVSFDFGTILVMGITTGLVVDDNLHFLHHLSRNLAKTSKEAGSFAFKRSLLEKIRWSPYSYDVMADSIDHTLRLVGKPILLTSLVLATALLTLTISELLMIQKFALFATFGVFTALISSLFLLPALILWDNGRRTF